MLTSVDMVSVSNGMDWQEFTAECEPGTWSSCIGEIARFLEEAFNWKVLPPCRDLPVAGRCDYVKRLIEIGDVPSAREALMVLAHEGGHLLHYHFGAEEPQPSVNEREDAAYVQGWHLLLAFDAPISLLEWQMFHVDEDVDAREVRRINATQGNL